jgi:hypothetical protein
LGLDLLVSPLLLSCPADKRSAQGLGDDFDGARRLESCVIVLPASVLTKISVDSAPEPTLLRTRFTSRVSVVAILSPAALKDSSSQEGRRRQRQLDSTAGLS